MTFSLLNESSIELIYVLEFNAFLMRFYPDNKIRFSGLKAPVDEVEIAV
jgi:hypothetical protein